jgi:PAS domain S-box-containing protein
MRSNTRTHPHALKHPHTLARFLLTTHPSFTVANSLLDNGPRYQPTWPVRLLRHATRVNLLALYVPLVVTLITPFACEAGTSWANTDLECWTGVHALFVATSVLALPLLLVFAVGMAATNVDRRPDHKRNLLSQPHGRVGVFMVLLKTVLALVFVFGVFTNTNTWFLLVVALVGGLAWLLAYARFLPYHQHWLNEAQCAISGVYLAAAVSGLLAKGLSEPEGSVGAWTFLFTLPLASFVGYALAFMSQRTFARRRELSSVYSVELKARYLLAALADDTAAAHGGSGMGTLGMGMDHRSRGGDGNNGAGHYAVGMGGLDNGEREARLHEVQTLYEDALQVFTSSALLELFTASFLGVVQRNRHLETVHLRAAVNKADTAAVDTRFFVWERVRAVDEEEAATNTVRTSVIRRLQFDRLQTEAEGLSMKARSMTLDYWTECCEKRPDMDRLQTIGTDIIGTLRACDNVFTQLQDLAPQSAAVMRAYADYLLDIANDPRKALELLQTAEQIEEDESKLHAGGDNDNKDVALMARAPDFDLSSENVSLVRVSAQAGKVGAVTDANPAALKLFGYGRRELIGRDIATLLPEPIAGVHSAFLHKYQATGREVVVNTSRILFGQHRNGYIFPMSGNVRPMEEGFGGVFEEIATSQAFIIFVGDALKWRVTACCKISGALLGIHANDIRAGSVTADRLVPGLTQRAGSGPGGTEYAGATSSGGGAATALMADLLAAHATPGAGMDVMFNVMAWSAAAAAMARSQRRGSVAMAGVATLGGTGAFTGITDGASRSMPAQREDEALRVLRSVAATAKLQELHVPGVATHMYVLRWRVTKAPHQSSDNGEDEERSSVDSTDNVRGSVDDEGSSTSGSRSGSGSDDDEKALLKGAAAGTPQQPVPHGLHKTGSILKNGALKASQKYQLPQPMRAATPPGAKHASGSARKLSANKPSASGGGEAPRAPGDDAGGCLFSDMMGIDTKGMKPADIAAAHAAAGVGVSLPGAVPEGSPVREHGRPTELKPLAATPGSPGPGSLSSFRVVRATADDAASAAGNSAIGGTSTSSKGRNKGVTFSSPGKDKQPTSSVISGMSGGSAGHDGAVSTGDGSSAHGLEHDKTKSSASVHSKGSSRHSDSSTGSSTEVLRKGIALRSKDMEASLTRLKRVLVIIFVFIGLMNVASLLISQILFDQLLVKLEVVADNGARGVLMQSSYADIQRLEMMSQGVLHTSDEGAATRTRLAGYLTRLSRAHEALYLAADQSNEPLRQLYATPSVTVRDLVPGTYQTRSQYNVTTRTVNLVDAGLEFIAKARQIGSRAYNSNTIEEPSGLVFWALDNGPKPIRDAMNRSMILAQEETELQSSIVMLSNHIVLGVALLLLACVTAFVMTPSVLGVLNQKKVVFNVFLSTPLPIVRSLRAKAAAKIDAMRRANEEAEVGIDVGGKGETDDEEVAAAARAGLAAASAMSSEKARKAGDKHSSGNDDKRALRKGRHAERRFRSATSVGARTVAAFAWPMAILGIYYVGTYLWKQDVATTSQYSRAEVFYMHQVQFMVLQANFNVRNVLTFCDADFIADQRKRFATLTSTMVRWRRLVRLPAGEHKRLIVRSLAPLHPLTPASPAASCACSTSSRPAFCTATSRACCVRWPKYRLTSSRFSWWTAA